MPGPLNPYSDWLGIPRTVKTLTCYDLLGLSPLENSVEEIREAARVRHVALGLHLSGPNKAIAEKLQRQIEAACACLTDPQRRAAYDAQMRAVAAGKASAESVSIDEQSTPTSSARADLFSSVELPANGDATRRLPPRDATLRKKSGSGTMQLLAVAGGLAAVVLLTLVGGIVWISLPSGSEPAVVVTVAESEPQPATPSQTPVAEVTPVAASVVAAPPPPPATPDEAPPTQSVPQPGLPQTSAASTDPVEFRRERLLQTRKFRLGMADHELRSPLASDASKRLNQLLSNWEVQGSDFQHGNFQIMVGYRLCQKLDELLQADQLEPFEIELMLNEQASIEIAGKRMFCNPRLAIQMFVALYGAAPAPSGKYSLKWLWTEAQQRLREGDVWPRPADLASRPKPTVSNAREPGIGSINSSDKSLAYNPAAFELPPIAVLAENQEVCLGPVKASEEDVEVQLLCEAQMQEMARTFIVEPQEPSGTKRVWKILSGPAANQESDTELTQGASKMPIAEFVLRDDDLHFRWLDGASIGSGNLLRNCILGITSAGETHWHPLRGPRIMWPAVLDLDSTLTSYPLPAKAYLPDPSSMMLELTGFKGLPAETQFIPENRIITIRDQLRIVLRQTEPKVEIRFSLFAAGPRTVVRVEPVVVDTDGKTTIPFTTTRINQMAQTLPKSIAQAKATLAELEREIPSLQAELSATRSASVRTLEEQNRQARTIARLNQLIGQKRRRYQDLTESIPQMERRLSILPGLADLGNVVNRAAELQFRVFYQCDVEPGSELASGGRQVDVLVADAELVPRSDYDLLRGLSQWTINDKPADGIITYMETTGGKPPGPASDYANFSSLKSIVVTMRMADGRVQKFNSELFDGAGRNMLQQIWDRRIQMARDDVFQNAADGIAAAASGNVRQAVIMLQAYLKTGQPLQLFEAVELFQNTAILLMAAETHLPPEYASIVQDSVNYDFYSISKNNEYAMLLRARFEDAKEKLKAIINTSPELQDELRKVYRKYAT